MPKRSNQQNPPDPSTDCYRSSYTEEEKLLTLNWKRCSLNAGIYIHFNCIHKEKWVEVKYFKVKSSKLFFGTLTACTPGSTQVNYSPTSGSSMRTPHLCKKTHRRLELEMEWLNPVWGHIKGRAHLSKLICPQLQVAKAGDELVSDHSLDIKGEYYPQNSYWTSTYKFFAFFAICAKFLPNWKVPCWPFRSWPMCFCGTTFSRWTLTNFPIRLKIPFSEACNKLLLTFWKFHLIEVNGDHLSVQLKSKPFHFDHWSIWQHSRILFILSD